MTVFGPRWNDLELKDVETFLKDAGPEPLLWLSSRSGGDARGRMGRLSRDFGAKGSPRKLRTR
jgi:hypothetical protein